MKKKFILLLVLAILLPGCSEKPETENETTPQISTNTTVETSIEEETEEVLRITDDLPEGLSYNGETFNILTRENVNARSAYIVDETNGEVLNDAIFDASRNTEERFDIDLINSSDSNEEFLKTYILAGDNTYDFANLRCNVAMNYFLSGYTYTYDKIPYVDLDKPYWDKSVNDSIKVMNRQYTAVNAFDLTIYDFTSLLLFNKQMITDFSLENPYELVNSGKWTFDKMDEMMHIVTTDMDGNGIFDANDRYGFHSRANDIHPCFCIGANVLSIAKDENDVPYLNMTSEKYIDVFNKVFDITKDSEAYAKIDSGDANVPTSSIDAFKTDLTLYLNCTFFAIDALRDMDTDFGIIPYPKYDEEQNSYYTRLSFYDSLSVPVITKNLERTGAIMEALACEFYNTVIPAYYDVALKSKYSRDEESSAMLDLIFATRIVDMGDTAWITYIRDPILTPMFNAGNRNIASKTKATEKLINREVKKLTEAVEKLDN